MPTQLVLILLLIITTFSGTKSRLWRFFDNERSANCRSKSTVVERHVTNRDDGVPHRIVVVPEVVADGRGEKKILRLRGFNGTVDFVLSDGIRNSMFNSDVFTVHRLHNHSLLGSADRWQPSCRQYTVVDDEIHGALSICQVDRWMATFAVRGLLFTMQPFDADLDEQASNRTLPAAAGGGGGVQPLHVVYKRSLPLVETNSFCGVDTSFERSLQDEPLKLKTNPGNALPSITDKLLMELAIFVDNELWLKYSRKYGNQADEKLKDYVNTVIQHVQIMYSHPSINPKITFSIVRLEVFKTQPKPLSGLRHNHGNALAYLNAFCKYQYYLGSKGRWDFALLFSGYDIHRPPGDKSISGIARLHGVCDPINSCLLAEGNDFSAAYITTHEIGHGMGMVHDEPNCASDFVMSASLGAGKIHWSTCSVRSLHNFLKRINQQKRNCLTTTSFPENLIATSPLPGQKYSADEQCQLVHGADYMRVKTNEKVGEGICHMLWCGQNNWGRIITSHPALEGTPCAPGKYCRRGHCVVDNTKSPPKVVDGVWSPWSPVSCHQCQCSRILASIGVVKSERSCSDPSVDFGGQECKGANLRAIVCRNPCAAEANSATSMPAKMYRNKICTDHRRRLNDPTINGVGVQLTRFSARACKVFCEVNVTNADSINFRFFGDSMPDGSPCGDGNYCVAGKCLPLGCDGKALVSDPDDCPEKKDTCQLTQSAADNGDASLPIGNRIQDDHNDLANEEQFLKPDVGGSTESNGNDVRPAWSVWSAWSDCSATCGDGYKTRSRDCVVSPCEGDLVEREPCRLQPCIEARRIEFKEPLWTNWGEWTPCSTTCGSGARARYRKCIIGNCPGVYNEVQQCDLAPCGQWAPWSSWSSCSVTCGMGVRRRSRKCMGSRCPGDEDQTYVCHEDTCRQNSEWLAWGDWSSCTVSCGLGSRQRIRACSGTQCVGIGAMSEQCKQADCAAWSAWTGWTECNALSNGLRQRVRTCYGFGICFGPRLQTEVCTNQPLGIGWTEWSAWSACTKSCGGGQRHRYRSCLGTRQSCPGLFTSYERCNSIQCPASPNETPVVSPSQMDNGQPLAQFYWSQWSACMGYCGTGVKQRIRLCTGPSCPPKRLIESQYCQLPPCVQ